MFKSLYRYEERLLEATRVLRKYPDRVPIIVEKNVSAPKDCPNINKIKYLVDRDLIFGQFLYIIRKRLNLPPEKCIFLFIGNTIPPSTFCIGDIYDLYSSSDKFLYITYTFENVFGATNNHSYMQSQL